MNKPEFILKKDDIPQTSPDCVKFKSKREPLNPLSPIYKLP